MSSIPIFAGLGWLWFIAMVVGYVIFLVAFWRIMKSYEVIAEKVKEIADNMKLKHE